MSNMHKSKDLSVREKQETMKIYNDMTKTKRSQRQALSKLGSIPQTAIFNLLQRDAISDKIKKNGSLSHKRNCDGKADDIESVFLN